MSDRDRSRLHKSKLDDFTLWLKGRGWIQEPVKGAYEVLRMRFEGKGAPVIFYEKNTGDHYTSHGDGTNLVNFWIRDKKGPAIKLGHTTEG